MENSCFAGSKREVFGAFDGWVGAGDAGLAGEPLTINAAGDTSNIDDY